MKKTTGLLLLLVSYFSSAACQTGNVYTDISCLKKQDVAVNKQMEITYSKLERALKADSKNSLSKSQKAWVIYRDEQCKVLDVATEMAQGAGPELAHVSCIANLNEKRLGELNSTLREILSD